MNTLISILFGMFIYYIIGVLVIIFVSNKIDNGDEDNWCFIYTFGPVFWPIILIRFIIYKIFK